MPSPDWWAKGDLFEGCNCDLVCPCHISFRQNSTYDTCDTAWGVHFEEGQYGPVSLAGLNAVLIARCPGPSMYDGNWVALLYVDDRATPHQEAALVAIFSGDGGGPWSRIAAFFKEQRLSAWGRAPFEFSKDRRSRSLRVGSLATLEVRAIRGADPDEEVRISNLYNVIHGKEHVVSRSDLTVDAGGLQWKSRGKHGLYSRFHWSGP
jgi:hypothetical protein